MSRSPFSPRMALIVLMIVLLAGCGEGSSGGQRPPPLEPVRFPPREGPGFFGVSAGQLRELDAPGDRRELDLQLSSIEGLGLGFVRATLSWGDIEPLPPIGATHRYDYSRYDAWVEALSRHHLRWQLLAFGGPTPAWAANPALRAQCGSRTPPANPQDFAELIAHLARRYGRHGTFWSSHPRLPYEPVTDYEVWNAPNDGGSWCPVPDPVAYAGFLRAAADAIHAVDTGARVLVGGLGTFKRSQPSSQLPLKMPAGEFLARMLSDHPELRGRIDAVAVHIYEPEPDQALADLASFRRELDRVGLAGKPISIDEIGWPTQGTGAIPEDERAQKLGEVASVVPRTDCGVDSLAPYAWLTSEQNPADPEDWFGIAEPGTGNAYPTAIAYGKQAQLFEGRGPTPPRRGQVDLCGGPASAGTR